MQGRHESIGWAEILVLFMKYWVCSLKILDDLGNGAGTMIDTAMPQEQAMTYLMDRTKT